MTSRALIAASPRIGVALDRGFLAFYAFWLVRRTLLPWLPGPEATKKRIAPYAAVFTDAFVEPVATTLRLSHRVVAFGALTLVSAIQAGLGRF